MQRKIIIGILVIIGIALLFWFVSKPAARTVAFHQYFIENRYFAPDPTKLDLENMEAVFQHVFLALDSAVMVYPTENYYYFVLNVSSEGGSASGGDGKPIRQAQGKPIWGNLHLGPESRDAGLIDFAYWEFKDQPRLASAPDLENDRSVKYRQFGKADGLVIKKLTGLQYQISYRGKTVLFSMNHLPQTPPKNFPLRPGEVFTQKTFDESGYSFFLIRNMMPPAFSFVLNDEVDLPEPLTPIHKNIWIGKKSGFVFYEDPEDHRKTLIGISQVNASKNNYYDGPFDQLADNYVKGDEFKDAILAVYPLLAGKIDKYGQFLDRAGARLAIAPYQTYEKLEDLYDIIKK
ncbi:MAG: hypothetical protein G01um10143_392 [Parcubacteria group bacterium Gr01-1014_3]|nr:MAG: hypothetical protein G01um10143_392 [Parcubacteria group bacterium Gr01-1014_3]